jgi:phosphatidylglycerol lysyltransferase
VGTIAPVDKGRESARALVLHHGWNAASYQILNRGMQLWFADRSDAVIGFVCVRDVWVVAGAPVCAHHRLGAVATEFRDDAALSGARVLYFGAGERLERLLGLDGRHHLLRLGAQPTWDPRSWSDGVRRKASLRAQLNRARNKNVTIVELTPAEASRRRDALHQVLSRWLRDRGLPALHFMTEPETLDDLRDRRVFVAERRGDVCAFLVATPVPAREGWLVEQWPRLRDAPNGTTHLLVDGAMRAFADEGARFATLGLAPLSQRAGPIGEGEPAWVRLLLLWIRAHGRRFYNFRGLDAFKAALLPQAWEPIYAIVPAPRVTLSMLMAVAGAFGGGSSFHLFGRALLIAMRRELARTGCLRR